MGKGPGSGDHERARPTSPALRTGDGRPGWEGVYGWAGTWARREGRQRQLPMFLWPCNCSSAALSLRKPYSAAEAAAPVVPGGKNCLRAPGGEPGVPQQRTRYTEAEEPLPRRLCTCHSRPKASRNRGGSAPHAQPDPAIGVDGVHWHSGWGDARGRPAGPAVTSPPAGPAAPQGGACSRLSDCRDLRPPWHRKPSARGSRSRKWRKSQSCRLGEAGPEGGGSRADRRNWVLGKSPERELLNPAECLLLQANTECFLKRYQKLGLVFFLVEARPSHWEPRRMKPGLYFS